MLNKLKKDLQKLADPEKAKILQGFFKTGKGQYGEGDVFLGITVPEQRKVAKKYLGISLSELEKLIHSKIHEYRLTGFMLLVYKYQRQAKAEKNLSGEAEEAKTEDKKKLFNFYLKNRKHANNWDIVDVTAPKVVGVYLLNNPDKRKILYKYAKSKDLWEKRIAIVSTMTFIRAGQFDDTLKISEILLNDKHDLIHKAVGWMLREVGKKDQMIEEKFLKKYYKQMPRTMLRYAIERLEETKRKDYLLSRV